MCLLIKNGFFPTNLNNFKNNEYGAYPEIMFAKEKVKECIYFARK